MNPHKFKALSYEAYKHIVLCRLRDRANDDIVKEIYEDGDDSAIELVYNRGFDPKDAVRYISLMSQEISESYALREICLLYTSPSPRDS